MATHPIPCAGVGNEILRGAAEALNSRMAACPCCVTTVTQQQNNQHTAMEQLPHNCVTVATQEGRAVATHIGEARTMISPTSLYSRTHSEVDTANRTP